MVRNFFSEVLALSKCCYGVILITEGVCLGLVMSCHILEGMDFCSTADWSISHGPNDVVDNYQFLYSADRSRAARPNELVSGCYKADLSMLLQFQQRREYETLSDDVRGMRGKNEVSIVPVTRPLPCWVRSHGRTQEIVIPAAPATLKQWVILFLEPSDTRSLGTGDEVWDYANSEFLMFMARAFAGRLCDSAVHLIMVLGLVAHTFLNLTTPPATARIGVLGTRQCTRPGGTVVTNIGRVVNFSVI
ncbi:hypothetical protein HAX54_003840 [Datura stramonium]|uniref:Uncharacterized protein n=1 Tax=Datura stramonium TaxID=4076 RepID=A0ABS8T892_DATST|nr:hypothetical protein [Datura stramonium]